MLDPETPEPPEATRETPDASPELGPTGEFPEGKLNPDDQGEIAIRIAADAAKNVVVIDFGRPVQWVAMPPRKAAELSQLLMAKAAEVAQANKPRIVPAPRIPNSAN